MSTASTQTAVRLPRRRRPVTFQLVLGISIGGFFLALAVFAPLIAPYDPLFQFRTHELEAPSATHLFGTDQLGRDILSRVIFGTRASFEIGIIAVSIGASVGAIGGILAGYFQGFPEAVIMRFAEAMFALPALILSIAFSAVFGSSSTVAAIAIGIATVPVFARVSRASTLTVRSRDYVIAARMSGSGHLRLIARHIVPNISGPIMVQVAVSMGSAVLVAAGLSFIGLGTQPPTPSWGQMLNESLRFSSQAPWYGIFPGVALTLMVLGLNALADGLQERFDHR